MKQNDFQEKYEYFVWIVIIGLMIFLMLICGCNILQPEPTFPSVPTNGLTKIVTQTNWLMSLAILAVGGGAFVLFMGNQIGVRIIAAALVIIITLLAVTKYAYWFAFVGFAGVVGLVGYTIWNTKKQHKTLNTALQEIVTGIESFKANGATSDIIESLKNAFTNQSDKTKQIVKTIKKNGNNNG